MGYRFYFSKEFKRNIKKFPEMAQRLIFAKINLLRADIDYPSLRTEKLHKGTKKETRASSISMGIRLIWRITQNDIIRIIDVGGHDILRKYG